jgi:hypothetical protein
MSPDFLRPGTSGEQKDERVELSSFPPPSAKVQAKANKLLAGVDVAYKGTTIVKTLWYFSAGFVAVMCTGAIWVHDRASVGYVDERDTKVAAADNAVHATQGAQLSGIDVRIERLVTLAEAQSKLNEQTASRLREVEAKATTCNAVSVLCCFRFAEG